MNKLAAAALGTIATLAVGYFGVGGWITANILADTLRVGAPTAQGSGWPAPQRPADIGYAGDPQAAFGYTFEEVSLQTDLGPAPAWLVPAETPAAGQRWAIFIHGIGGRRENGYRFLPVLHDAGLPTLMLSYRNDEGAPKDPSGLYAFGLTEWQDLAVGVQYALDNGASDVVLVAESMGGGITGQFLRHSPLASSVSAIVLDAPALKLSPMVEAAIGSIGLPFPSALTSLGTWISGMTLPVNFGNADVTDELANYAGPLFLSHGHGDRIVPVSGSDALIMRRAAVTDYLRTRADHILSWKEDPARYDAALAGFLQSLQ